MTLLVSLSSSFFAKAFDYQDDTFRYTVSNVTHTARIAALIDTEADSYVVPDEITIDDVTYPVAAINSYVFSYACARAIQLPSSLESIGDGAFAYSDITTISIPSKITRIPKDCFAMCPNLHSVTLPAKLSTISEGAFMYCENLSAINFPSTLSTIGNNAFYGARLPELVTLPAATKRIGAEAFRLTQCEHFFLPTSVSTIGDRAFADNFNLISVRMPQSATTIGNQVFFGCSSLKEVEFPATIGSIGEATFESCSSLTAANVSRAITSLPPRTFYNCTNLSAVTLPGTLTSIGAGCFYNCSALSEIQLPQNLTEIADNAFSHTPITSILLPAKLTSIGSGAFDYCFELMYITSLNPSAPTLGANGFSLLTFAEARLSIPEGSLKSYSADSQWRRFSALASIGIDEVIDDNDRAFPTFTIGNGILSISILHGQSIDIYAITGLKIASISTQGVHDIPLSPGVYILHHTSGNKKIIVD